MHTQIFDQELLYKDPLTKGTSTYQVANGAVEEVIGKGEGNKELAACPEGGVLMCHTLKRADHIREWDIHGKIRDGCC